MPAIVVPRVAAGPADAVAGRRLARCVRRTTRLTGQGLADEALKPLFANVGLHPNHHLRSDRDFPELSRLYFFDGSLDFFGSVLHSGPCRR